MTHITPSTVAYHILRLPLPSTVGRCEATAALLLNECESTTPQALPFRAIQN
ncbi:hypothetical protein [Leptolyngbya sp. FACHB-711]|uniref:hypothetical protein n=1 Tax=unclassified Leptolyngbya TaxID=2650499 RepID=UPI001686AD93|nr:hypothetical protein [Leptolyngbya sp. FACHB-711]MBD1850038.1 hypothetical protein [Cyanobacteria bacterium FACHB-502]MBD2025046.1 hypothetical protein [Leptolyngbya sp. FACHB-711]